MTQGRSRLEPQRLSDAGSDAPDALRTALQAARNSSVDSARIARLADRMGVNMATSAANGAGLLSGAPVAQSAAYKLWAYLSGVAAVSGVALVMWNEAALDERGTVDHAALTGAALSAEISVTTQPSRIDPSAAISVEASPMVEQSGVGAIEVPASRPVVRRRAAVSPPLAHAPAIDIAEVTPSKLDPQAELRMLNSAQDALAQAPRRALAMAEEHAAAYPRGVFAQEREVIAIEALLRLQRSDAAAARAQTFLSKFPTSTHAPRVQQMLPDPAPENR